MREVMTLQQNNTSNMVMDKFNKSLCNYALNPLYHSNPASEQL